MGSCWIQIDSNRRVGISDNPEEGVCCVFRTSSPEGLIFFVLGGTAGERMRFLLEDSGVGKSISYQQRLIVHVLLEPMQLGLRYIDLLHQLFTVTRFVEAEAVVDVDITYMIHSIDALIDRYVDPYFDRGVYGCLVSGSSEWMTEGCLLVQGSDEYSGYEAELTWESQYSRYYPDERIAPALLSQAERILTRIASAEAVVLAQAYESTIIQFYTDLSGILRAVTAGSFKKILCFRQEMGKVENLLHASSIKEDDLK